MVKLERRPDDVLIVLLVVLAAGALGSRRDWTAFAIFTVTALMLSRGKL